MGSVLLHSFFFAGLGALFFFIAYRYMYLDGNYLLGIGILALIVCGLLGLYLSSYSADTKQVRDAAGKDEVDGRTTANLIEEGKFESARSVTENTTNLLPVHRKAISGDLRGR
jgi:hypothetical protein